MAGKRFVRWLACLALVASACASASAQQVVAPGAAAQRAGADERPRVFVTEHSAHIGEGRILLDEAHQFAITDYAAALARGQRIGRDWYARVRARLAYFTGLSEAYLDEVSLDIHPARYMRELLRQRGLSVGRFDSRYAGRDFDLGVETPDADPSGYGFVAACAAAALHYLSSDLRVDMGARPATSCRTAAASSRSGTGRCPGSVFRPAPLRDLSPTRKTSSTGRRQACASSICRQLV